MASAVYAQPAKAPEAPAEAPKEYKVAAIRAYLYYHATGKLGDEDVVPAGHALFNTIIGEGIAKGPSSTVLVLVDLTGPTFANAKGTMKVSAKAGKRVLANRNLPLSEYFNEQTKQISVPLLVDGVGCEEVSLSATVTVGKASSKRDAKIEFGCGE
jgi:hypothetical protein